MTSLLDPVGPLPPGVYWRRRVAVVVVLIALAVVSLKACGRDEAPKIRAAGETNPAASASASPKPSPQVAVVVPQASVRPSPSPSGSPRPIVPTTCAPQAVQVHIDADDNYYRKSVKPKMTIIATNVGAAPCLLAVGTKTMKLVITSGRDRIWSSADCLTKGTSEQRLLQPRQKVSAVVEWNRVRSRPGCPENVPTAKPGTYIVDGEVAGIRAIWRDFFLLA